MALGRPYGARGPLHVEGCAGRRDAGHRQGTARRCREDHNFEIKYNDALRPLRTAGAGTASTSLCQTPRSITTRILSMTLALLPLCSDGSCLNGGRLVAAPKLWTSLRRGGAAECAASASADAVLPGGARGRSRAAAGGGAGGGTAGGFRLEPLGDVGVAGPTGLRWLLPPPSRQRERRIRASLSSGSK